MDTATRWALVIGASGFALGVLNFVYWAWWAKRDRVAIVIYWIWAHFVPKGEEATGAGDQFVAVEDHRLHIHVSCGLVLTRGEKEIEVVSVGFRLHKPTREELKEYFELPLGVPLPFGFPLSTYTAYPKGRELGAVLQPKKSVYFEEEYVFKCTDKFKEEYEKVGSGTCPDFIEALIQQLRDEYEICWTRYDGKTLCWRFPQRWYRNLGKRIWG